MREGGICGFCGETNRRLGSGFKKRGGTGGLGEGGCRYETRPEGSPQRYPSLSASCAFLPRAEEFEVLPAAELSGRKMFICILSQVLTVQKCPKNVDMVTHYICNRIQATSPVTAAAGSIKSGPCSPNHTSALNGNYEMQGVSKATWRRLLPAFYKSRQPQTPQSPPEPPILITQRRFCHHDSALRFRQKGQVQIRPHLSTGHAKAGRLHGGIYGARPDAFLPSFLSVETEHVSVPPFLCP